MVGGWRGVGRRVRVRLRLEGLLAAQSGVAAGLAWLVANNVLHHDSPFFAPIAAVVVLSTSVGQRWRRAVELVVGVAVGIAIGDALIYLIGVGVLQIVLVVTLAILAAVLLGGGSLVMVQAANSAVLVATLAPPTDDGLYFERFVDALVGGVVGLLVLLLVLPFNPLTRVKRDADRALTQLADALVEIAAALREGDAERAEQALGSLRATEADHASLQDSLAMGREVATLAPLRWRARNALTGYLRAAVHIERATRNARVLARRSVTLLRDGESVPDDLPHAIGELAEAVRTLQGELATASEPAGTREQAVAAAQAASYAYQEGVGFSGGVVVAQVRSAVVDLLRATGWPEAKAVRAVRRIGRPVRPAEGG